jgi:hypothetical protein
MGLCRMDSKHPFVIKSKFLFGFIAVEPSKGGVGALGLIRHSHS